VCLGCSLVLREGIGLLVDIWAYGTRRGCRRSHNGEWLFLEGELDIDECRKGLHGQTVLCMIEEVSVTALELWIPVEDFKGWIVLLRVLLRGAAVLCERRGLERLGGRTGLTIECHCFYIYATFARCTVGTLDVQTARLASYPSIAEAPSVFQRGAEQSRDLTP